MQEALVTHAKPKHLPTEGARTTEASALAPRPQRVDKPLPKPRASGWPLEGVLGCWRAFTLGLMVVAEKCCLGLPRTVKSESDGSG